MTYIAPDPPGANGRGCPGNCGELATWVSSSTKDQEGSLRNHGGVVSSQQQEERREPRTGRDLQKHDMCFFFGGEDQSNNNKITQQILGCVLFIFCWVEGDGWWQPSYDPVVDYIIAKWPRWNSWKWWLNFLDVSLLLLPLLSAFCGMIWCSLKFCFLKLTPIFGGHL